MKDFLFELGKEVKISCSGETGIVISRSQHLESDDQYLIRYKCADGRATESWWGATALEAA